MNVKRQGCREDVETFRIWDLGPRKNELIRTHWLIRSGTTMESEKRRGNQREKIDQMNQAGVTLDTAY